MTIQARSFPSPAPRCEAREVRTETDPETGTVISEEWFKDGVRDRAGAPAIILRDAATGAVFSESWWKNGEPFKPSADVRAAWLQKESGERVLGPLPEGLEDAEKAHKKRVKEMKPSLYLPHSEAMKQDRQQRVEMFCRELAQWTDQTMRNPMDSIEIHMAMLQTAFAHHLLAHGEDKALDMMTSLFHRTARSLKRTVQ
jgi:hypothetical protein